MKHDFSQQENEALIRMKEVFLGMVYMDALEVNGDWYSIDDKLRENAHKNAVKVARQAKKFIDKKYPTQ